MANFSMKRIVADALANYITAHVTGLTATAVQASPDKFATCPSLRVLPDSMMFEPTQADEVYENSTVDDRKVIVDVGSFTGLFQMQLYTASPAEREKYEQAVLDLFLSTPWASGTVFVTTPNLTVNGYASLYSAEVKIRLDGDEWNEEFAFEAKRYSFLEVYVDVPALTTYDASTIETLQLFLEVAGEDEILTVEDLT